MLGICEHPRMSDNGNEWDRRSFIPSHEVADNVVPCDPMFTRILTLARRSSKRAVIRDINTGVERTSAELLSDALNLRRVIRSGLKAYVLQDLDDGKEVYITLIATGGYEFAVGILAILALGAAASPTSPNQPVKELSYYVKKARAVAVVCTTSATSLGQELACEIRNTTNPDFVCIPIGSGLGGPRHSVESLIVSTSGYRDLNRPGIVIFTSGTTGPPKGAVLPLAAITDGAMSFAEQMRICETDTVQHLLPVHHATGIWVTFFPFLLSGACVEFRSGSFDPAWTWDRWRRGDLTHFSGVPTIYMRMMRHYQEHLSKLPVGELAPYRRAPSQFRVALCGTSALPRPIDDFWTGMMGGKRIVQRYGSSELGVFFNMPFEQDPGFPDGSAGEASLGVDVRLSEGDEGEILGRAFYMFSKYLHDPEATRAAFTEDGYFRSGDIARRQGKYYFIVGRASVDIIKSGGYKISALDIEREILALPYVSEVMVVGVPDDEFGQRVGAAVSLLDSEASREFYQKHGRRSGCVSLGDLRADLRDRLAGYKLPTLLRLIKGELPKSATNKVVKKILGPQYFPPNYNGDPEVQTWLRESKL
jgi:malonyl-CoA/methylmalonyl-CoA synthetase